MYVFYVFFIVSGRFHLVGRNGRIEKSVEAHKGAALVGQWSHDGAGLLTGTVSQYSNKFFNGIISSIAAAD